MQRIALLGATALSSFAVFAQAPAGAAPGGSYTLTCAAAGETSVTWRHAKLDHVTFAWTDQSGTAYPGATIPAVSVKAPHGYAITPTPRSGGLSPTSVTATFVYADGTGTDQLQALCN